jgi:putative flavoprotein involved in K+ transport
MADLKLGRLLDRIDDWVKDSGMGCAVADPERFDRTHTPETPRLLVDLEAHGIGTVLWATGFRPDYRWLQVPVFDRKGRLKHDGGVVNEPGLYALGLNFMRRRKSSFMHGTEDDVREIGDHLVAYLRRASYSTSPPTASFPTLGLKARRYVDSATLRAHFH